MQHTLKNVPLVVDLDGTLINTDLLVETANLFVLKRPLQSFRLLAWLAQGKNSLKAQLAGATRLDAATLPYNEELLAWLRAQRSTGRTLVLATASHHLLADQVALHLGLFDEVLATDACINLTAGAKRNALVARYGEKGYDYVGNDWRDVAVWQSAATAHVVSQSSRLIERAGSLAEPGITISNNKPPLATAVLRAVRPHQWVKNSLVFIPLLAAHRYGDSASVWHALLAFVVFSLTASSVYLLNDLVDVADDRHHRSKRKRPFAAGHLSLIMGWLFWPFFLFAAFGLAGATLPLKFLGALSTYFVLTVAYSLRLKEVPVLDVLTLASLYTLRLFAGATAVAVPLSFWLLSFSLFLFVSLAFIKRYSELRSARTTGQSTTLRGRGYEAQDLELVSSLGGSSGYISVLVLALYIQDGQTASLYVTPTLIWLACPLLLFWISRAWMIAHRGHMHNDPIVFALRDRVSWVVAILFALVFVVARLGP
jgi:4-hydroxybenzoate polyprenyltransferase